MNGHLLLDRSFHPHQADANLVLEQLTHGAYSTIAEIVDIVDRLRGIGAVLQLDEILDGRENVRCWA